MRVFVCSMNLHFRPYRKKALKLFKPFMIRKKVEPKNTGFRPKRVLTFDFISRIINKIEDVSKHF